MKKKQEISLHAQQFCSLAPPSFGCGPQIERTLHRKQCRASWIILQVRKRRERGTLLSFAMDTSQGWPRDRCPFFSDISGTQEIKKVNQAGCLDVDTLSTGALLPERKQVPCQQSAGGTFLMLSRPWRAKRQTEITHIQRNI